MATETDVKEVQTGVSRCKRGRGMGSNRKAGRSCKMCEFDPVPQDVAVESGHRKLKKCSHSTFNEFRLGLKL